MADTPTNVDQTYRFIMHYSTYRMTIKYLGILHKQYHACHYRGQQGLVKEMYKWNVIIVYF